MSLDLQYHQSKSTRTKHIILFFVKCMPLACKSLISYNKADSRGNLNPNRFGYSHLSPMELLKHPIVSEDSRVAGFLCSQGQFSCLLISSIFSLIFLQSLFYLVPKHTLSDFQISAIAMLILYCLMFKDKSMHE